MKRLTTAVILVALLAPAVLTASSSSVPYWKGGYRATLDGFSALSAFTDGEYGGVHLYLDPFQRKYFSPSVSVGSIFSIFPSELKDYYAEIHAALVVASLRNHLLVPLMKRPSYHAPRMQAGIVLPFTRPGEPIVSFIAEPLNFFFGEKYISILGFRLLYDPSAGETGWGVRIFDISHMFF